MLLCDELCGVLLCDELSGAEEAAFEELLCCEELNELLWGILSEDEPISTEGTELSPPEVPLLLNRLSAITKTMTAMTTKMIAAIIKMLF